MVLSKRWNYLYTFVPTLEYDHNSYPDGEDRSFSRFVYSSLLLSFVLGQNTGSIDIGVCVRTAIKRHARHLNIEIDDTCSAETINPVILPTSLYTGCTMLVILWLINVVLMDSSSTVSFPSLKILVLLSVKYPNNEFVPKILAGCPVLENLFVDRCQDAPCLELMGINVNTKGFCGIEHNMPKIDADAYPEGIAFNRLVELTLCTSEPEWLNLLMRLLKDSPKLRVLKLEQALVSGLGILGL
ncbi:probable FBD-associated F-box protein At1g32375 [Brassica napus]|uniref:probable FBD-associated F-box protein At1g32375 n=1 Tax=Brassica napus TaxID=3708 RepID=UPI0006AA78EA|nr:probable FBD-associated F-box protein At1g32375 [Brassica napus]